MCTRRTRSSASKLEAFILGEGGGDYLFAKVATEIARGPEVCLSAEYFGEFRFHGGDAEQAGTQAWFKLDEEVDNAVGAEAVGENGSEER